MENSSVVLEKVCEYLYYFQKNIGQKDVPDMDIPPELILEIMVAADYLNSMGSPHGAFMLYGRQLSFLLMSCIV